MGRSKLRLGLLGTAKARRRTYETRKKGLEKKASELSTLCGVDLCFISYPPPLENEETRPFVWSSDPSRVANLIESHKLSRFAGGECSKSRTCDLAWFYKDQTKKVEEEIEKLRNKNREAKYPDWDQRYDSMSSEELRSVTGILADKIAAAKARSDLLKERNIKFMESNTWTNPVAQENVGCPLPYIDAETNYYLEYRRRTLLEAAMTMDMAAPRGVGINPALNHSDNGFINVNPMIYNLETAADQEPRHAVGYGPIMINHPADHFPHMDATYGQGLIANNPADYYYPQMDPRYGEDYGFNQIRNF